MSGGGTNTVETQSGPPQQFLDAYSNVLGQAQTQAAQPLQQYSGPQVAGFTPAQTQAMQTASNQTNTASPYINAAAQEYGQATTPLWSGTQQFSPQAVNQYESPYTQQVVNSTQSEFNNQNSQQQQGIISNAATSGAWGGDRASVAQGIAAGQEALAQAPTIANLENTGYSQALGEFNTQQQAELGANESNAWLGNQAAGGLAGLGTTAQATQLTGANAEYGAGTQQQALEQQQLNVPYQDFLQQQAYPYQNINWLANIAEGAPGGNSSTTSPGASIGSQIGGGALAATGVLGETGAFGPTGYLTGTAAESSADIVAGDVAAEAAIEGGGAAAAGEAVGTAAAAAAKGGPIHTRSAGGIIPHRANGGDIPGIIPGMPQVTLRFIPAGTPHNHMPIPQPPRPYQAPPDSLTSQMGSLKSLGNLSKGNNSSSASSSSDMFGMGASGMGNFNPGTDPTNLGINQPSVNAANPDPTASFLMGNTPPPPMSNRGGRLPHRAPGGIIPANQNAWAQPQRARAYAGGGGIVMPQMPTGNSGAVTGYQTAANGVQIPMLGTGSPSSVSAPVGGIAPNLTQNYSPPSGPLPSTSYTPPNAYQAPVAAAPAPAAAVAPATYASQAIGAPYLTGAYAFMNNNPNGGYEFGQGAKRGGVIGKYADGAAVDDDDDDDAVAPPTPLAPSPVSVAPSAPAPAPSGITPAAYTPIDTSALKAKIENPQVDPWQSVMAAGLGMMSGTSPSAGVNIGRGALMGMQQYGEQKEVAKEGAQQEFNAQAKAQDMAEAAEKWRSDDATKKEQLAESVAQRGQDMDFKNRDLAQTGAYQQGQLAIQRGNLANSTAEANRDSFTYMPGTQADPNDPTKTISGVYALSKYDPDNKQFIPNMGISKAAPGNAGGAPASVLNQPNASGVKPTGDDVLKALNPQDAAVVKAMVDGRQPPPTSMAMSKPYWQSMIQAANQYDPTFDQTTWTGRVKTRNDFTAGKAANNITAINTALGHAAGLSDNLDQLNNGSYPPLNAISNYLSEKTGNAAPTNAKEGVDALASEARKVFSGTGGGNLAELEEWQKNFPLNGSPDQQKGSLNKFVELLDSRLSSLGDQYNRGMGRTDDPRNLLSPNAQTAYTKLTGRSPEASTVSNGLQGQKQEQQSAPAQTGTPNDAQVDHLKANPNLSSAFDQKFGAGSAQKILGGQ